MAQLAALAPQGLLEVLRLALVVVEAVLALIRVVFLVPCHPSALSLQVPEIISPHDLVLELSASLAIQSIRQIGVHKQ